MEKENTKLIRTRKYRLKLNSLQKKLLETHRHNYRFLYNKAIYTLSGENSYKNDFYKETIKRLGKIEDKASYGNSYSENELRNLLAPEEVNSRNEWVLESGYSIREQAIFEAHRNWKRNVDLVQAGLLKFFNLKYKSKRDIKWTINVSKSNINTKKDYHNRTEFSLYKKSGFIKTKENFEIDHDCSIHFDGKYYFILVPHSRHIKESQAENFHVALDPGQRKFQVSYSPLGGINVIGKNASEKIYKLLLMIDKCISNKNKKLEIKLRRRVSNLQLELHNKTSKFLCENYKNIYIPKLTSGNDIIKKSKRRLKTKTVRAMVILAHCKFVEKLKTKALEYTNVKVHVVTEEYTSQTCLKCKNKTKTTNELFKCKICNFKMDRDILGSRNILLKSWNLM
jgi:putative transposase